MRSDSVGNLWVAGTFSGTMTVGDEGGHTLLAQGFSDVYLIKFVTNTNAGCAFAWGYDFGVADGPTQVCTGLDVDSAGNALIVGQYTGSVDVGGTSYTAPSSGTALFAATFDVNGVAGWSKSFANGSGEVHAAFDAKGEAVLAGGFFGDLDLGGAAVSNDGNDHAIFVGKLSGDGTPLWLRSYGNPGEKDARAVAVTGPGESVVVGIADGVLDIGGIPIQTAGGWDAFVARFAP